MSVIDVNYKWPSVLLMVSYYFSLNRISPSKLSLCASNPSNGLASLDQNPVGSDSSCHRENGLRSMSSEEFLAMERSAEVEAPRRNSQEPHKDIDMYKMEGENIY